MARISSTEADGRDLPNAFQRGVTAVPARTIDSLKLLQSSQQPGEIFLVAGVDYIEIECRDRRSVKHRAHSAHDDKVNAVPGQDLQYFQKPGIRTLHGV